MVRNKVKNTLRATFHTDKAIFFEYLHKLLKEFLENKEIQLVLNNDNLFKYYFVKYFLKKYVIYNKYLLYFSNSVFLENINQQLCILLEDKSLDFIYNGKKYEMDLKKYNRSYKTCWDNEIIVFPLYIQLCYNKKWMIFYGEKYSNNNIHFYCDNPDENILKNIIEKNITCFSFSCDLTRGHEQYLGSEAYTLFDHINTLNIKLLMLALREDSNNTFPKDSKAYLSKTNFPKLKNIMLLGKEGYYIDFESFQNGNLKSIICTKDIEVSRVNEPEKEMIQTKEIIFSEPSERIQIILKN